MIQRLELTQNMSQKLQLKLVGKIKVAEFLSVPEPDFEFYIKEVEQNPLFTTLKDRYGIIRYRKFFGVKNTNTVEFKEELAEGQSDIEMEGLLSDPSVFALIRKIGESVGEDTFRKMLYGDVSIKEVVKKCNLCLPEEKIFKRFIDKLQLQQMISSTSSLASFSYRPRFFLIAAFVWEKDNLIIHPVKHESYLVKGKYQVNYDKFDKLIEEGVIKRCEVDKAVKLFKRLDMINRRTTTIYRILNHLREFQHPFFKSGNVLDLLPLSQSELARELNLSPSTVSRAIARKSLLTPQGEEKPIKFFLSKGWAKNLVKKVILKEKREIQEGILSSPLTDEQIQKRISEDYGINLSRRSIAKYRKVLNIPPSHQRKSASFY